MLRFGTQCFLAAAARRTPAISSLFLLPRMCVPSCSAPVDNKCKPSVEILTALVHILENKFHNNEYSTNQKLRVTPSSSRA